METLIVRHIYAEDYDAETTWRLAAWCQKQGANEWTLNATPVRDDRSGLIRHFEEVFAPYQLPTAARRQLTASRARPFVRPTPLWLLQSATRIRLQEFLPNGLFTNSGGKQGNLEDPILYRNGELVLGIVSHEREGILRVTEKDFTQLEAHGFLTRPYGTMVGY